MKPYDAYIFFTSTLLGFDEPSRAIQADDQAASDLRIQSSAMSCFLDPVNVSVFLCHPYKRQSMYLSMRLTHATTS